MLCESREMDIEFNRRDAFPELDLDIGLLPELILIRYDYLLHLYALPISFNLNYLVRVLERVLDVLGLEDVDACVSNVDLVICVGLVVAEEKFERVLGRG